MIFKSTIGTGVSAALRYVQGQGRDENGNLKTLDPAGGRARLLGGQGFGFNPQDARQADIGRRIMEYNARPEMQGNKDFFCSKDALHISLSWARGQTPDVAEKLEASKTFLKALGMENAMALTYDHNDKSYSHIHIVASRINPETGMAYDDYQRLYRGMHQAIEWERAKNQVTKPRQWCHDLADATRGQVDHEKLKELLFKNEATVKKSKIDLSMAFGGHFGPYLEAGREEFVRHHDLVRLKKYQVGRTAAYTTKEIWQEENQILGAARRLKDKTGFVISDKTIDRVSKEMTLTPEQQTALRHMTRDTALALMTGEAGTGKSHSANTLRKCFMYDGYKPKFLSTTNKVVQDAQRDGHDSSTIASELMRLKFGLGKSDGYKWDAKTVLIVDEVSQFSHPDTKELFDWANRQGAAVRAIGDEQQLGSVDRGGLWHTLTKLHGSARLTEVMRNKDPDHKRAYNKMHELKWKEAVEIFKKSDSIRWNDLQPESIQALTKQYATDFKERPNDSRLIVAGTNDEVNALNKFVQDLRKQAGELGKEMTLDTSKGPTQFHINDRIVMNESAADRKEKTKGLVNGAFGWVRGLETRPDGKNQIEIEMDRPKGQQRRLFKFQVGLDKDNGDMAGVGLGYASTVYKSQGSSIDSVYVLHNPANSRPTNYVELTRHKDRNGVKIYASREDTSGYADLTEQLKSGDRKRAAHDYMIDDAERLKLDRPMAPGLAPDLDRSASPPFPAERQPIPEVAMKPKQEEKEMFKPNLIRETIHRVFGSKEDKSRVTAVNNMIGAHIYENWGVPAPYEPAKWSDFLKQESKQTVKDEPQVPQVELPWEMPIDKLYESKGDVIHQLFGTGERSREEIDKAGGEAQRNQRDFTDQTAHGRQAIKEKEDRGMERDDDLDLEH